MDSDRLLKMQNQEAFPGHPAPRFGLGTWVLGWLLLLPGLAMPAGLERYARLGESSEGLGVE